MSRRPRGNPVDGVLLLNKPRGITSQTAVSRVKRLFSAAKAGHTGTLDPLADGLLPVCLGEATKFSQGLLDADKGYRAVMRLGITTTTGDLEGDVLEQKVPTVDAASLAAAVVQFRGDIPQIPPMYSALKRDGKPLYVYARAGKEVPREARTVHISQLEIVAISGADVTLDVQCSKGTYVRVLAEDIGRALGCGAALAALTRTVVGSLRIEASLGFEALESLPPPNRHGVLLPVDSLVQRFPRLDLGPDDVQRLRFGQAVESAASAITGIARAYGPGDHFVGLVECEPGGRTVARRLVSFAPESTPVSA